MMAYSITENKYCIYAPYYKDGKWDGKTRITLCDLRYMVNYDIIKVPAGFVTDLGSVPDKLKGLVDDNDESTMGFILHDYLFKADCPYQFPRSVTDRILKTIIRRDGQSWYTASKTWLGVVIGRPFVPYHKYNMIIDKEYMNEIITHISLRAII